MSQLIYSRTSCLASAFLAAVLSLSCGSSPRSANSSANASSTSPTTSVENYELPNMELKGVIEDVDYAKGELKVRLSADQFGEDDRIALVRIDSATEVEREGATSTASTSPEFDPGMTVTVLGQPRGGEVVKARRIMLGTACKSDYCPVKGCRQKCGVKTCVCPKLK